MMKLRFFIPVALLAAMVAFGSCSSGKLNPLSASYIKVDPQPLEAVGNQIPVVINATFPENWFNKNATLEVVPVLRYDGGEAWGTTYTFQGENVAGNGLEIPQKKGKNVVMTSTFGYVPKMQKSELYLTFAAKIKNQKIALPDIKIGDGVLATAALATAASETPAIAPDKYQRIIKETYDANIMFLIQQAELRSSETRKEEVDDWIGIVANADYTPNQKVDVEISAYASPDGGYTLNEKLSEQREKNTKAYVQKQLKKEEAGNVPMHTRYTAQDWEGFKTLVENSNIQDKDLILRTLSMYTDPERREREIKNMSSTFTVLAEQILPQLRRSRLIANVQILGKSDEELSQLSVNNPGMLTSDELLYAATLVNDIDAKEIIYHSATELYPNDFRGFNNVGAMQYLRGRFDIAADFFNYAAYLNEKSPEVNFNMGLLEIVKGNNAKAQQYLGNAAGVGELNNAMAVLALQNGEYSKAAGLFRQTASNNAALAQIMTKDYNAATTTLNAVANPDATTAYLKAVIAARTNNINGVVSNLKQSFSLDRSMKDKAAHDLEFSKFMNNSQFKALF